MVGADQRPGELIGFGPVHAELARTIATAPGASWWYVLTGPDGAPLAIGQVRARPEGAGSPGRGYSGVQVWLQANQSTLDALAHQSHPPGWDRVIAEITAKAETNTGPPNGDPAARLPGAALRRWITVRDRTCSFPGCRVPAHRADADHSVEHAAGGETVDTNLGPSCRHDHRLRHEGGWTITQTQPGNFTWTSRLGHTYHRQPPPDFRRPARPPCPDPSVVTTTTPTTGSPIRPQRTGRTAPACIPSDPAGRHHHRHHHQNPHRPHPRTTSHPSDLICQLGLQALGCCRSW